MSDITTNILEAIDVIVEKRLAALKFDKTIQGHILRVTDPVTGAYSVQYQDSVLTVFSKTPSVTYSEGDQVIIEIPSNDFGARKTILSKVIGDYEDQVAHEAALVSGAISGASSYADTVLGNFVDDIYAADFQTLQTQIDGQITTYFYEVAPTMGTSPANEWTTDAIKNNHLGDLYYDSVTGYGYRFAYLNNTYQWLKIIDVDVLAALRAAQLAQDTADGKRRVFVSQPIPPYDVGDLWAAGSGGDLKKCVIAKATGAAYAAGDWSLATKYTDDAALNTFVNGIYSTDIQGIRTQIDGKADTFYSTSAPHSEYTNIPTNAGYDLFVGDLWYDSDASDRRTWIYRKVATGTSTVWVSGNADYKWFQMDVPKALFDFVDGKNQVFVVQPIAPYDEGDLWAEGASGDLKRCKVGVHRAAGYGYNAADWESATKYTDDTSAFEAMDLAKMAQETADGQIQSFYQDTIPTNNTAFGDIWLCTSNGGTVTTDSGVTTIPATPISGTQTARIFRLQDKIGGAGESIALVNPELSLDSNGNGIADGWDTWGPTTADSANVIKTVEADTDGVLHQRFQYNGAGTTATGVHRQLYQFATFAPGEDVLASFLAKGSISNGTVRIEVHAYNGSTYLSSTFLAFTPTNAWQKVSLLRRDLPANTTRASLVMQINASALNISYDIHMKETRFVKGLDWAPTPTNGVGVAFLKAYNAQATADGKRRVFVSQPVAPYDEGDLWTGGSLGDLKRCKAGIYRAAGYGYTAADWEVATKYTDDSVFNAFKTNTYDVDMQTINRTLDDMESDSIISAVEKRNLLTAWNQIVSEGNPTNGSLRVEASALNLSVVDHDAKYLALNTYLNTTLGVFADMAAATTIVVATWNTKWNDYMTSRAALVVLLTQTQKAFAQALGTNLAILFDCENAAIRQALPISGTSPFSYFQESTPVTISTNSTSRYMVKLSATTADWPTTPVGFPIAVKSGEQLYVEWKAYRAAGSQPVGLNLSPKSADGTNALTSGGAVFYDIKPRAESGADVYCTVANSPDNTWTKFSGFVTVPSGVGWITPELKMLTNLDMTGSWYFKDFIIRRAVTKETIVAGAITADSLRIGGANSEVTPADLLPSMLALGGDLQDLLVNSQEKRYLLNLKLIASSYHTTLIDPSYSLNQFYLTPGTVKDNYDTAYSNLQSINTAVDGSETLTGGLGDLASPTIYIQTKIDIINARLNAYKTAYQALENYLQAYFKNRTNNVIIDDAGIHIGTYADAPGVNPVDGSYVDIGGVNGAGGPNSRLTSTALQFKYGDEVRVEVGATETTVLNATLTGDVSVEDSIALPSDITIGASLRISEPALGSININFI